MKTRVRATVLRRFLTSEAAGGLLLIGAAAAAMLVANSSLGPAYSHGLELKLGPLSLHHWINDGLMAVFFLLVGLEIKRELVCGALADPAARRLPLLAAAAGMAVPALLYLLITGGDPRLVRGWAIPAATDIAFALGVLALLGRRVPASLKLFLATVAIVDDMGAVAIIALVYTAAINGAALAAAAVLLAALAALGRFRVRSLLPYLLLTAGLWAAMLLSGVHATLAGVLAALCIPADGEDSPLHRLEHALAGPVGFGIVPLFGFANAGVALGGLGWGVLAAPVPLAVAAGLFLGKQAGVLGAVVLAAATGIARPPAGASWRQLYGTALLCGIGFTMSLFIAVLAFPADPELADEARLGVLLGSLLSALAGYVVLRLGPATADARPIDE
jgi:Na+:H+ antiporter, NhaA family